VNEQSGIFAIDSINQKLVESCNHEVWIELRNGKAACDVCGIDE
jgi:hypothetical protein